MIRFLKKYKSFVIGFIIIIPIFYLLGYFGFIILPKDQSFEIIIYAIFWGVIIALPFHHFKYLKKHKKTVFKIVGLILLLFIALVIDRLMSFPDNPITFILLLLFWIGLVYVLIPSFITKYWRLIVLFYVPLFLYFIYIRMFSLDFEAYLKIREDVNLLFLFVPVPLFLGLCLWIYEQWKWVQTLKADKAETELALLKTQINPHFFFNTLNNLYALTIKNSKQAPEVILKLSDMMRYTIYEGKKEVVSLKEEITYLKNYLELHKIRYHKSVTIQFEHAIEEDDTIAPLLFIILLENALKHGVESLMQDAFVKMNLISNAKEIHFTIENNFDPHEIAAERGIGLENLKQRLSLIYPKRHEFTIIVKGNVFAADLKIKKHD
jgi:sensor histidine kinase YesM